MNGKSLMKHHYLKKNNFAAIEIRKTLQVQITYMQKSL